MFRYLHLIRVKSVALCSDAHLEIQPQEKPILGQARKCAFFAMQTFPHYKRKKETLLGSSSCLHACLPTCLPACLPACLPVRLTLLVCFAFGR
jgi:hypothetical protein